MKQAVELPDIKRILVVNLAFIGDVLLTSPLITALQQNFPLAKIDMMVTPTNEAIAKGNPWVDKVVVYDKRGKHKKLLPLLQLIRQVRATHYDLAISTNFAVRGAAMVWAAGIPRRIGYDIQHGGLFLTQTVSADRSVLRHETENNLALLTPLQITTTDKKLYFVVSETDRRGLAAKVPELADRPLAAICPIGRNNKRTWTTAGYADLIRALAPEAQVLLIGGAKEAAAIRDINQAADNQAVILAGTLNLGELAALLAKCTVLVTVDTGPMHLAQAVDTPVVALFGPADPIVWGPRGPLDQVFYEKPYCSPCWGNGTCEKNICMTAISSAAVIAATRRRLNN